MNNKKINNNRTLLDQWHLISTSLKQDLQGALGKIKGSIVESLITSVMRDATRLGKVFYGKELKALAERSGTPHNHYELELLIKRINLQFYQYY